MSGGPTWLAVPLRRRSRGAWESPRQNYEKDSRPDIWRLSNGNIAVIGHNLTDAYRSQLPADTAIAPDERLTVLPANTPPMRRSPPSPTPDRTPLPLNPAQEAAPVRRGPQFLKARDAVQAGSVREGFTSTATPAGHTATPRQGNGPARRSAIHTDVIVLDNAATATQVPRCCGRKVMAGRWRPAINDPDGQVMGK